MTHAAKDCTANQGLHRERKQGKAQQRTCDEHRDAGRAWPDGAWRLAPHTTTHLRRGDKAQSAELCFALGKL